jgi:hypothetical protein
MKSHRTLDHQKQNSDKKYMTPTNNIEQFEKIVG